MDKGDIKATIILLAYIVVGITSGYYFQLYVPDKQGAGSVLGFILGILGLGLLQCIWGLIRLEVED
jgi:uncharacterized membrane protein YeaQ/YmgE (transglycosylase-associated protein family)